MLLPRVIPCLLLKGQGLVKGVQFKNHRYIGDPINAVQIFNAMEVDELLFLDILATQEKRTVNLELVQKIADQCLMPFGVGGGIQTIDQVRDILKAGAEKVCICSAAVERPSLIEEISKVFGSQSVVVSIDVKKTLFGNFEVYIRNGTKATGKKPAIFAREMEAYGAGELLINAIDRDGTMEGYDLKLLEEIRKSVSIPVIACGGAGTIRHLKEGLTRGHASAVAAGSMFVFYGKRRAVLINYPAHEELNFIQKD